MEGEDETYPQGNVIGALARYICDARRHRSAPEAREAALKCLYDLLGATLAGLSDPGAVSVRATALQLFPGDTAPLWFTGQTASACGAAWANSAAAAALDLDDGNRFARGHPGAAVIPAALAVGGANGRSCEEILTAIVIGYEVGVSIGAARTSYGNSGTWTAYAVAATAAALSDAPPEVVAHALAIAGESAPNQLFASAPTPRHPVPEGSMVKEGIPWSVVTGRAALSLAQAGHTGPRNLLDSPRHYAFTQPLTLGASPHICRTYIKPWACCRHIHAPLAAMLATTAEHEIDPAAITSIVVEIHDAGLRISNRVRPENLTDVQYSIPYCLALAALEGTDALVPVTAGVLGLEEVEELASRVALERNASFDDAFPDEIFARVHISCGDRMYSSEPTAPPGEPLMPWRDLEAKFARSTRFILTGSELTEMASAVAAAREGQLGAVLAMVRRPVAG
ncbi:MmgE/PrpD family protein [Vannielia litorea]|uniref:MmgE/PrpD family protein n=1 Tax=Vannielia litorea TaxID=1217970 RepID=UPI001C93E2DB|nr:MmgE/PrpD family protein [Vannielia litorea]MBY6153784.1 MmgE/PrpD family protein [Vannielia litorea]